MPAAIERATPDVDRPQEIETYREVLDNPAVRAVGAWQCPNHDGPLDEAAYVAKAVADLDAFSDKLDLALALL